MKLEYVYAFKNANGGISVVNYDAKNSEINSFLHKFDVWRSDGEYKVSMDGNHQEVWFELPSGMWSMLHSPYFHLAFRRMNVRMVFEYPD